MGISITFVMNRKIHAHTFCDKVLVAKFPNEVDLLLPGYFSWKCSINTPSGLTVFASFFLFRSIPEHGSFTKPFWCSRRQQDLFVNNFVLAVVVMGDTVSLIFDLLSGDVGCFCDAACTGASRYDLDTEMINSNCLFLLRDLNFLKMFRNILFVELKYIIARY